MNETKRKIENNSTIEKERVTERKKGSRETP